jgi:acyl carrier protein
LVDVVAEKTGYPAEALDFDMQLDADLGIDSIKRVEILSAMQDRLPELPPLTADELASFRSLRAIVEHWSQYQTPSGAVGANRNARGPEPPVSAADRIARILAETVAEQTGFPSELLDLDMRLDADLGIDSIKRVAIFSAIQDRLPEAPPAGPEEIGALGTLREIVTFLARPCCQRPEPAYTSGLDAPAFTVGEQYARVLLEAVGEKTGYPIDMLELDMRLDVDLGIDSIKRVEIFAAVQDRLPFASAIGAEQLGSLSTLREIVEALACPPSASPDRSRPAKPTEMSQHDVSYNRGPWAGGIAKGPLKTLLRTEGLTLIPPEAGARLVVDEIAKAEAGPVGVVPLVSGGALVDRPGRAEQVRGRSADRNLRTVLRRMVDFDSVPILASHVIDGHGVLPLALLIEWLAEAAVHANPGLLVCGLDELRLFKGVILEGGERASVEVRVGTRRSKAGKTAVTVELRGTLPAAHDVTLARAEVLLADRYTEAARRLHDQPLTPSALTRDEVYRSVLFHGPSLHGIEWIEGSDACAIAGWVSSSPSPSEWIRRPVRSKWLTNPLALDAAFGLVVLWCSEQLGACALPSGFARYRQFRPAFPADGARVVAEIREASPMRVRADLEFLDARSELVARLDSCEWVVASSLNRAFRRNQLAPGVSPILSSSEAE